MTSLLFLGSLENSSASSRKQIIWIFWGIVLFYHDIVSCVSLPASVAQLDAPSDWRPGGRGFNPRRGRQHSFMEIDSLV